MGHDESLFVYIIGKIALTSEVSICILISPSQNNLHSPPQLFNSVKSTNRTLFQKLTELEKYQFTLTFMGISYFILIQK